jgi:enterobactin synthetase component F
VTADPTIFTLVRDQAARTPDAVAVIDDRPVTYAVLADAAERVARFVAGAARVETPVGVLMRRDAALVATLLGVMGGGSAYLPLDPDDPPLRHRRVIDAAGCPLVIGDEDLLATIPAGPERRVPVRPAPAPDRPSSGLVGVDGSAPLPEVPASGLAYVMFTSGSTGTPKGVEVEHGNMVALVLTAKDLIGFTAADRYLALATVAFDISVAELFVPLVCGGSLVLRDRHLLLDPKGLARTIVEHGVTVAQTGPTVWAVLLREVADFPRLRVVVTTGEALAPPVGLRLTEIADEAWNLYGPTETTVWTTGYRLPRSGEVPAADRPLAFAPVGLPFTGVAAVVCDQAGVPVPDGAEGELWLGGAFVARGYRGRPELTAERFIERDGLRWYRSGDIIVRRPDGVLEFHGRADDQIKIRGVRIEPMEVEAAVLETPGVAQVAATWFERQDGGRSIVAAVVETARGASATGGAMHARLAATLPGAMIPSRVVVCDALPRSASGKVDRNVIRAWAASTVDLTSVGAVRSPDDEPRTATERELVGIWERTLGITGMGRGDHFFSVGGDSLAAVTMVLDAEAAFGVSLPVRSVFEAPTVAELAERIDLARAGPSDPGLGEFVFRLVPGGTGIPVFFVGAELKLARRGVWTPDCPVYAITHWARGVGFAKTGSVEEMARFHLPAIRAIQPRGPYRLAGYSFGGLLALELAQQLRAAGEDVALLFLLDPMPPLHVEGEVPLTEVREGVWAKVRRHARAIPKRPRAGARYGVQRLRDHRVWQWTAYRLVDLQGRHPNPVSAALLRHDRWPAYWYASARLGMNYVARPYGGPAMAVFAEAERHEAWRPVLGDGAEVHIMVSQHHALTEEPDLGRWMARLEARLGQASA